MPLTGNGSKRLCPRSSAYAAGRGPPIEDVRARGPKLPREAFDRIFSGPRKLLLRLPRGPDRDPADPLGGVFEREESWRDQLRGVAFTLLDFLQEDAVRARVMIRDARRGRRARWSATRECRP